MHFGVQFGVQFYKTAPQNAPPATSLQEQSGKKWTFRTSTLRKSPPKLSRAMSPLNQSRAKLHRTNLNSGFIQTLQAQDTKLGLGPLEGVIMPRAGGVQKLPAGKLVCECAHVVTKKPAARSSKKKHHDTDVDKKATKPKKKNPDTDVDKKATKPKKKNPDTDVDKKATKPKKTDVDDESKNKPAKVMKKPAAQIWKEVNDAGDDDDDDNDPTDGTDGDEGENDDECSELRNRLKSRKFHALWDALPAAIQEAYSQVCCFIQ